MNPQHIPDSWREADTREYLERRRKLENQKQEEKEKEETDIPTPPHNLSARSSSQDKA